MLDLIREGWDRLVRFFSGSEEVTAGEVQAEISPSGIPAGPLSATSESEPELQVEPVDLSRWNVTVVVPGRVSPLLHTTHFIMFSLNSVLPSDQGLVRMR